jgi:hypothetical protein
MALLVTENIFPSLDCEVLFKADLRELKRIYPLSLAKTNTLTPFFVGEASPPLTGVLDKMNCQAPLVWLTYIFIFLS